VLTHDLVGPNARAKRIDERLAKETPALANVKPAARISTAILAFSFGGLKRDGEESLPPGVGETELLAACVGPDLDSITASGVLGELRNSCLYLHYDGVRYCFKKDPNVTMLIEEAEQEVSRDSDGIRDRIKELLEQRLSGKDAIVWPLSTQDLPDKEPRFLIGYMPLDFAGKNGAQQDDAARTMLSKYGDTPRRYRNGVGLAVPEKKPIESLRRAVRFIMAIERVESKAKQHKLTKDQTDQLKERRRTEEQAAESAFRQLYPAVWLPRVGSGGSLDLDKIEVGGRPLQATGIHERLLELLTVVGTRKLFDSIIPKKIAERVKLGEAPSSGDPPRLGIATSAVLDAFFEFLEPPRIGSDSVLRKGIARGVGESAFAYTTGTPTIGAESKYQVNLAKVVFGRAMSEDEVDLDAGFLIAPPALPSAEPTSTTTTGTETMAGASPTTATTGPGTGTGGPKPGGATSARTLVRVRMSANRDEIFKSFKALANLAEKSDGGKVSLVVEGHSVAGFDQNWLRNAVEEPLDEANIEGLQTE